MRVILCLLCTFPHSVLRHCMNFAQDTWAAATISMHPWSPLWGKMTPYAHCPLPPAPGSLSGSSSRTHSKFYSIHSDALVLSLERITKSQSPLSVTKLCQGPSLKPLLVLFFSSDCAGIQRDEGTVETTRPTGATNTAKKLENVHLYFLNSLNCIPIKSIKSYFLR